MRGITYGACSAMPAFAQALTLALREMLQKGGQFSVQRLEISSKKVNQRLLRTVACRGPLRTGLDAAQPFLLPGKRVIHIQGWCCSTTNPALGSILSRS
jgi:hypothetical protein